MMKTQNPYSTVTLIQMSMFKTQESDDDDEDYYDEEEQPSPPAQWKQIKKWGLQSQADHIHVLQFTGGETGKKRNKVPHMHKDSSPLSVLMLCFTPVIHLLVKETNRYYLQYVDRHEGTTNPLPDTTNSEMLLFLAITVQMGHGISDRHVNYWIRAEQFFTHFYLNTKTQGRLLHILHYVQITDNDKEINKNDYNYDRLWKIRKVFDILNVACLKFYNPSGHW
jgi:hypothetical protein